MSVVVGGIGATRGSLPFSANCFYINHGKHFVGAGSDGGVGVIPQFFCRTFDDFVGVTAKANGTSGKGHPDVLA
jgi:hypothetical protein